MVGTGAMGSAMPERLLREGWHVTVWHRTAVKVQPLVELGARRANGPREAAAAAHVVITMVSDPEALRSVVAGNIGIAAGLRTSSVLMQMATVDPPASEWLSAQVPNGTVLDAPVLGSTSEAKDGSLLVFLGGDPHVQALCMDVVNALGTPLRSGDLGSATAAKLVANLSLIGSPGLLGEALLLGRCLGLETDLVFEILSNTPLAPQAARRHTAVQENDYPLRFALELASKDADLIVDAAKAPGVDLAMAASLGDRFAAAQAEGRGGDDYSAILASILARSPAERPARKS